MALTPEQKQANKEARWIRDSAFRARTLELEKAKQAIDVASLNEAVLKANAAQDEALFKRNEEERLIQAQIAELQDKLNGVRATYQSMWGKLRDERTAAYDAMREEHKRQEDVIFQSFKDLDDRDIDRFRSVNSANWVPPEGYLERYAAEHAEELAKKRAEWAKASEKKA